ncbi:MAG: DUF134 domain-containing protein [Desulfosudaceae bacterium]
MSRPKKKRNIVCDPDVSYFKPRGVPMRVLKEVGLTVDEYESIRLADLLGLTHEEAGLRMGVSRATFGRIVQNARRSIAKALVNGMAIRIEGGDYKAVADGVMVRDCAVCGRQWEARPETEQFDACPRCDREASRQE